jgi:hypothetical protein
MNRAEALPLLFETPTTMPSRRSLSWPDALHALQLGDDANPHAPAWSAVSLLRLPWRPTCTELARCVAKSTLERRRRRGMTMVDKPQD